MAFFVDFFEKLNSKTHFEITNLQWDAVNIFLGVANFAPNSAPQILISLEI